MKKLFSLPDLLEKLFEKYAILVFRFKIVFFLLPIAISIGLGIGWSKFQMDLDVFELFSPEYSDWSRDRRRFQDFFGIDIEWNKFLLFSAGKGDNPDDYRNLLDPDVAENLTRALEYINNDLMVEKDGRMVSYEDELRWPDSPYELPNRLARWLISGKFKNAGVSLTYPVTKTKVYGDLFLPLVFGGISVAENSTRIEKIRFLFFHYVLDTPGEEELRLAQEYEEKVQEFALKLKKNHSELELVVSSYPSLAAEVRKTTFHTLRFVPPSAVLVLIFIICISSNRDMNLSCHLHAIFGLISVMLAFISGLGFLFYLGYKFNDLVSLTAFLALAIGVDDMFVLVSAWRRHMHLSSLQQRLQAVLKEAGSSITFTSLTDVVAFGIGASVEIPGIRNFCICTAVAIGFDFLFQITFFPAAMLYCESLRPLSRKIAQKVPLLAHWNIYPEGSTQPPSISNQKMWLSNSLMKCISHRSSKLLFMLLFLVIFSFGLIGMVLIKSSGTTTKLAVDESFVHDSYDKFNRFYWSEALPVHVIVKSPNISEELDVNRFFKFVSDLENTTFAMGKETTSLWLREVEQIYKDFTKFDEDFEDFPQFPTTMNFSDFLVDEPDFHEFFPEPVQNKFDDFVSDYLITYKDHVTIRRDVRYANISSQDEFGREYHLYPIEFHFATGFRGLVSWNQRVQFMEELIALRHKYSEYEASFFNEIIQSIDIIIYTRRAMRQTMGIVLLTTFIMAVLFLPYERPLLVFWVSTSFLTINASVIGYLSLWGVDSDAISMVAVMMSVGFSVDYTVHLAYYYARQVADTQTTDSLVKVRKTLEGIGSPILYSGLSTLVAVSLVGIVQSYMMRVFLKTLFLVVSMGLFQSLIILPVVFLLMDRKERPIMK